MLIIFAVLFELFHEAFGLYLLSGSPEHVVLRDNVTVTLTCVVDDSLTIVTWRKDTTLVASIKNECKLSINADPTYTYTCDLANKRYYLIIPPDDITDGIQNVVWACLPVVGNPSNTWSLALSVPVTTVIITPAGDNSVVSVIEGETQTFTCTTDSSRPASWIQWYIGGQNMTNQATPQPPQQDGGKFISSSSLAYTGSDVDHNKVIFCTAVNIEERQKVKSGEKSLYIQLSVTTVTITPAGDKNVVSVIEGETQTFTCTTGSGRPAAWIQWYIGGQNVTNQATPQPSQQDGDKFISSSSLVYTGRDVDHNTVIFCEAVNIEGRQKVRSTEKFLYIPVPVTTVTITPAGDNNVVDIVEGETHTFSCTTDSSRPAAWIQWYIGGQNVTNQATPQPPLQDRDKLISSSSLVYTGRDVDNNNTIFCEAVNIEGRQKVKPTEKSLYIQSPVTRVTITPAGDNNVVDIIEGKTQTFTCTTDSSHPAAWILWYIGGRSVNNQATPQPPQQDGDKFISSSSLVYTGIDVDHNKVIFCEAINIEGRQKVKSTEKFLYIQLPVTTVTITPAGDNNVVDIIEGETQTFTCTTDSSRPASWIQWYIGGQNVTNQATPQSSQQDGDLFISSSSLMYTGRDVDHSKVIFCEAVNIEGRQKVKSKEKYFYIQLQVTTLTITPAGDNNVVDITEGEAQTFTCTTDPSRPAAWIQWYIGIQNVTNQATLQPPQQDGDNFISSSSLVYTGRDDAHNKVIFCEAVNIDGRQKVKSTEKSLYIQVPVTTVTITPAGDNNVVYIIDGGTQTFTCTTDYSRPAAWIQWYIGGQKVTNQATTPQPPQQDGDKFISSSSLVYTGRVVDHNKVIFCEAINIGGTQKVKSTEKYLYIQIQPQLNIDIPSSYELIALEIGMSLNITVNLLANPVPTIQWSFRRNDSTDSVITSHSSSNWFEFTSHIFIQAINKTQFGSFIVIATNTIGSFNKTFSVIEQVRPTAPVVVYVVCQTTSAVVLWRSEFNGGSKQKFYVQYRRISQSSSSMLSPSIPDPGVTADLEYTVDNLVPDTIYIFHIIAGNEFEDSLSKPVKCNTDKRQNPAQTCQDSNGLFAAGISTLVIGLLSIIFAVLFTVFCRLRRQTKEQIRSNDYTEFKTCTRCNPVVTDSYDSLDTTNMGTTEVNENQTDRNIATYEEIKPSENTANTDQHQTKLPLDVIKKQEGIYDNMKP